MELPPRARRILPAQMSARAMIGTTSACAENTTARPCILVVDGNYLRVRGEYRKSRMIFCKILELPPRARRIHSAVWLTLRMLGTTSVCAENTGLAHVPACQIGNYLRVRGEYRSLTFPAKNGMELPPRARRIPRGVAIF